MDDFDLLFGSKDWKEFNGEHFHIKIFNFIDSAITIQPWWISGIMNSKFK